MNSPNFTTEELKKLNFVSTACINFLKKPTWTIPVGAMLISGIYPVADAKKLPDQANQLLNPTLAAAPKQLGRAFAIIGDWAESHEHAYDSRSDVPMEATPVEFLMWSENEYQGALNPPEFLEYFFVLAGFKKPTLPPLDLLARLLELEQYAAVERNRPIPLESQPINSEIQKKSLDRFTKRMKFLKDQNKIRSSIAKELGEALDWVGQDGPSRPSLVWARLQEMAKDDGSPLKLTGRPDTLKIPGTKTIWKTYTRNALGQYLRKHEKLLLGISDDNL